MCPPICGMRIPRDCGRARPTRAVTVNPPVAFSLPHALIGAGLLETEAVCHYGQLAKKVRREWRSPGGNGRFWEAIEAVGVTLESIEFRAAAFGGARLGRWFEIKRTSLFGCPLAFCRDLTTTLAVLSRISGPVFSPEIPPEYAWDNLLKGVFYFRDPAVRGYCLPDPVWPQAQ